MGSMHTYICMYLGVPFCRSGILDAVQSQIVRPVIGAVRQLEKTTKRKRQIS